MIVKNLANGAYYEASQAGAAGSFTCGCPPVTRAYDAGDWILTAIFGERFSVKPDAFTSAYEVVE
jgi:hypothetical protein